MPAEWYAPGSTAQERAALGLKDDVPKLGGVVVGQSNPTLLNATPLDAVLEADPRSRTVVPPIGRGPHAKKLTIAENANGRITGPNGSPESAVGGQQRCSIGKHGCPVTHRRVGRRRSMQFQAFQHQGSPIRAQQLSFLRNRFRTQ